MTQSEEELKSLLMEVKEESENVGLKLHIQKTKIMASGPITAWEIMGKQWKPCQISFLGGSKTTMAGREELKSLLMKVKVESENAGLKFSIQKMKIMASDSIISWQIDGETMRTMADLIFLGSKITADGDCSHES